MATAVPAEDTISASLLSGIEAPPCSGRRALGDQWVGDGRASEVCCSCVYLYHVYIWLEYVKAYTANGRPKRGELLDIIRAGLGHARVSATTTCMFLTFIYAYDLKQCQIVSP